MKKDKTTVLLVSLGLVYGGAETYYVKLAKILIADFSVVAVVCCPRLRDEFNALGIDVIFPQQNMTNANRYLHVIKACWSMARRYRPQLAHCNGQPESYLAPFLRIMGLPVITTRHTPFSTLYMKEGSRTPASLKQSVVLFCLRFARKTICVSQLLCRQLAEHLPADKLVFIPTWVDDHLLIPYTRPEPSVPLRALFLGRVVRNKGIFDVIETIRHCPGVHLTVVGEGDQLAEARALAKDLPITFAGFQSDAPAAYRSADLLIFASPEGFEGLPQVPLEALAMGVPCLASNISSILEIAEVPEGQPPVLALYQQGDVKDLVRNLRLLTSDRQRLEMLSNAGREQVQRRFTVAAIRNLTIETFMNAMLGRRSA